MTNHFQNVPSAQQKSYADDVCKTPVDDFIEQIIHDTHNGKLFWHKSRSDANTFEHTWGLVVVRLTYEMDIERHVFTLSMRKSGEFCIPPTLVAQHVLSSMELHEDLLRDLWQAIQEYVEYEQSNFPFVHMERYIASSKEVSLTDELSAIITSACREII